MKITLASIIAVVCFAVSNTSFSQEVDANLAEACYGDIELTEFTVQMVNSDGVPSTEMFDSGEVDQIQTVLEDEALEEATVRQKLEAVIKACSEGRILLDRFSSALPAG